MCEMTTRADMLPMRRCHDKTFPARSETFLNRIDNVRSPQRAGKVYSGALRM